MTIFPARSRRCPLALREFILPAPLSAPPENARAESAWVGDPKRLRTGTTFREMECYGIKFPRLVPQSKFSLIRAHTSLRSL